LNDENKILYYLYKFNLISLNIFNLFKSDHIELHTIIYIIFLDNFYLRFQNNILNLKKYINDNIIIIFLIILVEIKKL